MRAELGNGIGGSAGFECDPTDYIFDCTD